MTSTNKFKIQGILLKTKPNETLVNFR